MSDNNTTPTTHDSWANYPVRPFGEGQASTAQVVIADFPTAPAGSILSTAVDRQGAPVSKPTPDTRVTVRGIGMLVSDAVREGFLIEGPDGSYTERSPSDMAAIKENAQRAEDAARAADAANHVVLSAPVYEIAESLDKGFREIGTDLVQVLAEMAATRQRSALMDRLAMHLQVPPNVVTEQMEAVMRNVDSEVDQKALKPAGVDSAKFYEWIHSRASLRSKLSHAYIRTALGELDGYRALVTDFGRAHGRSL